MKRADVVTEALGAATIITLFGAMMFMTLQRNEAVLAVSDCVGEKWEEFETRTGTMPSIELEREWQQECVAILKG